MRLRRSNRGFSLLEVMVALGILTASLAILVETQAGSAKITRAAERVLIATDLASAKLTEGVRQVEEEGFIKHDLSEDGDFDDWGDDASGLEFRDDLEEYKWELEINEVDLALAGDIAGMASELESSGVLGGGGGDGGPDLGEMAGGGGDNPLASMGVSSEMITEMIAPYIREIRVRVWWGEDSERAAELGHEVVVVTHVVNPTGIVSDGQDPEEGVSGLGGG